MLSLPGFHRWIPCAVICAALCGCLPSSQGPQDEQKEPHFLTGKARESELDFNGAVEAFEKALEANPQNSSAHYELGLLHEKQPDFAAAIYHFERYLKLRPDAPNAQIIKERISADKMELSKTALFAPVTQGLQREFDKLAEENKTLRAELERYRAQAGRQSADNPPIAGPQPVARQAEVPPNRISEVSRPPVVRKHLVQQGETPTAIARRYGIKLDALMAANPGLDPKRMKVGQALNVPPAP